MNQTPTRVRILPILAAIALSLVACVRGQSIQPTEPAADADAQPAPATPTDASTLNLASAIATAEAAARTASTVVSDAQAVWPIILETIPEANRSTAQQAFSTAIFGANHGILALNDAIQVAIAANNPAPDFSSAIASLSDAIAQVVATVKGLKSPTPITPHMVTPGGVNALTDMQAGSDKIKSMRTSPR